MTRTVRAAVATAAACAALALAAPAQAHPFDPKPGADGVGDPLFPTLGNGGYDVRHYDLSFDFTPVTYDFTGTMKISAKATQDLSSFNLDIDSLAIDAVKVDGKDAAFAVSLGKSGQELTVTPAGGLHDNTPFEVAVTYHGNGRTKPIGAPGWRYMSDGGFASAAQSSRADTFAPVNDTTMDKASWTFHLTAPDGWTPGANGTLTGTRPAGEGKTTSDFRLNTPMASELLGISVEKQTLLTGKGPHGVTLRHYVPDDQVATYRPIVEQTGGQIAWLEKTLGVRFPFDTYGMQIVRDGYSDALENQTLSLFGPGWFKNASTSTTYTNVMVHEMTHQWFGDSVTPTTWQSAWLNEGPAVYYAALWADQQGTASMEDKMRTAYGKLDAVRKTDGPPGLPTELGGFNIYDGAAVVLYALNQQVGQDDYDAIMKSWLTKHRHANADSQDFIDNAVRVTHDPSLRPFLEDWLFSKDNPPMPGHPDWS
ncbi:M1 family metallopeptidase [Streptomyces sp. NPDC001939]|uniref:M1 family metallopeptidase n=1 Tax=Streptomyces TaxID=1883 RepID=UPI001D0B0818|nr:MULTISPECIES: M1 family metallopeptidase [Streptomyces]MCX5085503.1 M1 family metallopeptidase [Streptomyces sp. NBC_00401]UDM03226.1 M1 family metallopeptidase [Streptomyces longhuiensis]